MKHRLKIEIDAPHIEEYHDVLYYVQQQIDMGFTGGSGAGSEFFSRSDIKLKWSIKLVNDSLV
tara:strand:+ start:99 stop:287 length:189 start_codon:yes stop_codon:yes gene_type:complete